MNSHESPFVKTAISWFGLFLAWITLQKLVWMATLAYTSLNIYVTVRKLRKHDGDKD